MNTTPNPLLADGELPLFSSVTPDHVLPAVDAVLADYQATVDRLVADPSARSFDALIAPLEALEERLGRCYAARTVGAQVLLLVPVAGTSTWTPG